LPTVQRRCHSKRRKKSHQGQLPGAPRREGSSLRRGGVVRSTDKKTGGQRTSGFAQAPRSRIEWKKKSKNPRPTLSKTQSRSGLHEAKSKRNDLYQLYPSVKKHPVCSRERRQRVTRGQTGRLSGLATSSPIAGGGNHGGVGVQVPSEVHAGFENINRPETRWKAGKKVT